jgi:hypothetical protein
VFKNRIFRIFGLIRWAIIPVFCIIENGPFLKHLCTWILDWILFVLKCRTTKITLNDLKENCVKIVEIFFRLNINGNMIRTSEHSRAGLVKFQPNQSLSHRTNFLDLKNWLLNPLKHKEISKLVYILFYQSRAKEYQI